MVAGGVGAKRRSRVPLSLSLSSRSFFFFLPSLFSHTGETTLPSVVVLELAPVGPAGLPEGADLLLGHVLPGLLEGLPVEGAELVEALWKSFFFFFFFLEVEKVEALVVSEKKKLRRIRFLLSFVFLTFNAH